MHLEMRSSESLFCLRLVARSALDEERVGCEASLELLLVLDALAQLALAAFQRFHRLLYCCFTTALLLLYYCGVPALASPVSSSEAVAKQ